jgi:glycosyltransferase involved in cell wall biosynthesis
MRRLLIFSYHFPPSSEVAGKPTAKLVRRLSELGWEVTVLVPPTWAYFHLDTTAYTDIGQYARIEQTELWMNPLYRRALDHVRKWESELGGDGPVTWSAIKEQVDQTRRRKPPMLVSWLRRVVLTAVRDLLSVPDLRNGWIVPAYRHADRLLRRERFDALLSVSPSMSAHLAALLLLRRHPELVWFAQFHDPFTVNPCHPRHVPGLAWLDRRLESTVAGRCDRLVCATEEASAWFANTYDVGARSLTIHNGFDPDDFPAPSAVERTDGRLTFTYTGTLGGHRDPKPFFESLGRLIRAGQLRADGVRVRLIGECEWAGDRSVRAMANEQGLESVVEIAPPVPYPEALGHLVQSDVLLLFAEEQPIQIPAKLFEYLYIRRNILAFCTGATARVVSETRAGLVVTSGQPDLIDSAVLGWAREYESGSLTHDALSGQIDRYRADVLAGLLVENLEAVLAGRSSPSAPDTSPDERVPSRETMSAGTGL